MGIRAERFTREAKLVLRLGSKYSLSTNLKESLMTLVTATTHAFLPKFKALHDVEEAKGLEAWQKAITRDIHSVSEPRRSKRDLLVSKGIKDLKNMDVILKLADKNLGIVAIHKHVYLNMARNM